MKISHTPVGPSRRIGCSAAVPPVEVTDDADAVGVGRPDAEMHAVRAADREQVRAQLVVDARVLALREQVDVVLGDDAAVAVGIVDGRDLAIRVGDSEAVVDDLALPGEPGLEHARVVDADHTGGRAAGQDLDALGSGLKGADDQGAGFDVRAQERERIGVARTGKGVEGVGGVRHGQIMYPGSGIRENGVDICGHQTGQVVLGAVEREHLPEPRAANREIPAVAVLRLEQAELPPLEARTPPPNRRFDRLMQPGARGRIDQLRAQDASPASRDGPRGRSAPHGKLSRSESSSDPRHPDVSARPVTPAR